MHSAQIRAGLGRSIMSCALEKRNAPMPLVWQEELIIEQLAQEGLVAIPCSR
jgi:hypothetical protein